MNIESLLRTLKKKRDHQKRYIKDIPKKYSTMPQDFQKLLTQHYLGEVAGLNVAIKLIRDRVRLEKRGLQVGVAGVGEQLLEAEEEKQ